MSRPPITIDGPHRNRAARRERWQAAALAALAGLLIAAPCIATTVLAWLGV